MFWRNLKYKKRTSFIIYCFIFLTSSSLFYVGADEKKALQDKQNIEKYELYLASPLGSQRQQEYITHVTKDPVLAYIIWIESKRNKVDPYLILSIIRWESEFNQWATGYNEDSKDVGYMQLNSKVYTDPGLNYYDKELNIKLGVKHLADNIKNFDGDIPTALKAYNGGIGNVWRNTIPPRSVKYANKVLTTYRTYITSRDFYMILGVKTN